MIPHVTDVPGHTDPDFKSALIFYSFSINWFPFPLFGKHLLIFNIALRDHSSENDFQACFYKNKLMKSVLSAILTHLFPLIMISLKMP